MPPSTWSASHVMANCGGKIKSGLSFNSASLSAFWYSRTTASKLSAISLELTLCLLPLYSFSMTWQKATARFIGS